MPQIQIESITEINADIKTCFDLARDISFHQESLKFSMEKAISGKISGLIELGEWVTWEAKHLGFVQHLTTKVTEFDAPNYFVVKMVLGAFESLNVVYRFVVIEQKNNKANPKIKMTTVVDFKSPHNVLGKFANRVFLKRYMTNLLKRRCDALKTRAEELYIASLAY